MAHSTIVGDLSLSSECPSTRQGSTLEPELMVFVCGHRRDIPEEAGFRV